MLKILQTFWNMLRQLSGDDAYERYLKAYARHTAHGCGCIHEVGAAPLSKKEFFKQWQDHKWQGINRCC